MFRKEVEKQIKRSNKDFIPRGHEIMRIEAFSDAVFAFAVTLLIVSLEVPKSFDELMVTMRGFFAFGISFLFLMMIWYAQNVFFRHYGLNDTTTIVLNSTLIFVVLFYVYPLKFLFTLAFRRQIYGGGVSPYTMNDHDMPKLMMIYGLGYTLIYTLFFLMYLHALRKKEELDLSATEIFATKTRLYANLILIVIGIISVIVSQVVPPKAAGTAGMIYFLIGPAFSVYHSYRGSKKRKLKLFLSSQHQGN